MILRAIISVTIIVISGCENAKFGASVSFVYSWLQNLVEQQFDTNIKFKDKVNMISADELRVQPIGRDIQGRTYWSFMVSCG